MKELNYILRGFGYLNLQDFKTTTFKVFYMKNNETVLTISVFFGLLREFIENALGLDIFVVFVLVLLIIAEWQTGLKADILKRGEKFQSRKFGRMILKIGVYIFVLYMLNTLSERTVHLSFEGFSLNPFRAVYYIVFVAIIMQLIISYFENLGVLGYSEAKGIAGIVLRKYNKWFEFDGEKNGDREP